MSKEQTFKVPEITVDFLSDTIMIISGLRLSYPNLFKPGKDYDDPTKLKNTLDSSFILPRENFNITKQLMARFVKQMRSLDPKLKSLKQTKNPKLMKPDEEDYYIVKTTNSLAYPPKYINCHSKVVADPLAEGADNVLYAGCYTTIKIELNPDFVKDGKVTKVKVWCNLVAIQFLADGEPFGKSMTNEEVSEGFGTVKTGMKKAKSNKPKSDESFDEEFDEEETGDEEFDEDFDEDLDEGDEEFDEYDFDLDD